MYIYVTSTPEAGTGVCAMPAATAREKVRPAAVAGRFYPADPARMRAEVARFLAEAGAPATAAPAALIAPHAGYVYSGRVAGAAFATLRGVAARIARVVIVGPAHYVPVRGIAIPTVDAFETPLGTVAVDRAALAALATLACVIESDRAHAPEHALEVELPFLQAVLPAFRLVPVLVGEARPQDVTEVLARVWDGPRTLVVASSDLSHYYDYDTARRLDAATAAAIERGEETALGPARACGWLAVAGLLRESARRGLAARRLALCNSGDTAGPREQVVGYGAWSFAPAAGHSLH
jgi:AmmeMemoRadiSam system protein B